MRKLIFIVVSLDGETGASKSGHYLGVGKGPLRRL